MVDVKLCSVGLVLNPFQFCWALPIFFSPLSSSPSFLRSADENCSLKKAAAARFRYKTLTSTPPRLVENLSVRDLAFRPPRKPPPYAHGTVKQNQSPLFNGSFFPPSFVDEPRKSISKGPPSLVTRRVRFWSGVPSKTSSFQSPCLPDDDRRGRGRGGESSQFPAKNNAAARDNFCPGWLGPTSRDLLLLVPQTACVGTAITNCEQEEQQGC